MKMRKKKSKNGILLLSIFLLTGILAGCGKKAAFAEVQEEESYEETKQETGDSGKNGEMLSDQAEETLHYMEKVIIEDYYGTMEEYEMYAPIGSDYHEGYLGYYDHGIMFSAMVCAAEGFTQDFIYELWEDVSVKSMKEEWQNDTEYFDVQIGEIMENGDDRYLIVSACRNDFHGTPYVVKRLCYLDMRGEDKGVDWTLSVSERDLDEDTEKILEEIAQCYDISLEDFMTGGEWAENDAQRRVAEQDVYEPETGEKTLDEVEGYQYLGAAMLSFDDGTITCPVLAPMGWKTYVEEERVSSSMHGVSVSVKGYHTYSQNNYMALLKGFADDSYRYAKESETNTKNVEKSEIMAMRGLGMAAYCIISYDKQNDEDGEYESTAKVKSIIRLEDTDFLLCDITLRAGEYDASTDILLKELETAYGMDLSEYYYDKKSGKDKEEDGTVKAVTMAELLGESGILCGETALPETVLWFNATYAALTYSNGWDWHLISGLEPTQDNIDLTKMLLRSSWSVEDRESALETADSLITKGHRGKCRECMEQLEEWGLLDLSEEDFVKEFLDMEIEDHPGRYVVAYMMHQEGIKPEYIAAWDLCRVNQLYADYYTCGFMSYEEAMDASLENSLRLQEMYGSWEEMMDAYIWGYQFWQGDLAVTENSPTRERYHYYEMLRDMPDGPYSLDWNMDLKKSW